MRIVLALSIVLAATATVPADPTAAKTERRASRVHAAWTFAALGSTALVTSFTLGYVSYRKYEGAFDDGDCYAGTNVCNAIGYKTTSNARTLGNVATVTAIAGWGLLGTAAIVYLTTPRDAVAIAPTASTDHAGLVVSGGF